MGHGYITIALEHHGGERAARLHITVHELGDDIGADLPIGDGLDHANRDQKHDGEEHSDDKCPPCQMSIPGKAGSETESE